VITSVEGNRYLKPLQVLEGSGSDSHDLLGCELLLPLGPVGVRPIQDVVDILANLREIILQVFCLLLLDLFGQLEIFIYKALQPVVDLSLVLSLRMEVADSILETFVLTQLGPFVTSRNSHFGM
jgi:hypothetical protein